MKRIVIFILLLALVASVPVSAEEIPDDDYDGCQDIYRIHESYDTDPFYLYAEPDERFCEMLVYSKRPGLIQPYSRIVPGQLCYPDYPWSGSICMAFYSHFAAAWSDGETYGLDVVYVKSERRYAAYMPLIHRNYVPGRRRR